MSKFRLGFLIAALFAVPVAFGQIPPKPDDKKDPQEKFEPKGAPGAGQKFLARLLEGNRQIFHIQKHITHENVFRGSNASRTASPIKISNVSMVDIRIKIVKPSHGA